MAPDWTDILFVAVGVLGVAAFVAAERRDRRGQAAPHPVAVQRRRVAGTGAGCVGLLGALLVVEHYTPGTWDGVLRGLVVTDLVALMGLVVGALVLAGRTDRAEAAHPADR